MINIIYHQKLDLKELDWDEIQYLAIEGNEKDLQEALRRSSYPSKIVEQMLKRGKPIILLQLRKKERREGILRQYSSFLTKMSDRERKCMDRKILVLDLKRV